MWVLRTRNYILTCVILIGCLYLVAYSGIVPLFLTYVMAAYLVFVVITFFFFGRLLLKFLPAPWKELHSNRQLRYFVLLLIPVIVFVVSNILFRSVAPHQQAIPRVFGVAGMLIFSAFVLWHLLTGVKRKPLVIGTILFLAYLTIMSSWASTRKSTAQEPSREELAALPYVAWVEENSASRTGITIHKADEASPGVNLYAPNSDSEAFLIDMNGQILHKWVNRHGWEEWAHVALNENGDLLAIYKDKRLSKFAWDSRVLWRQKGRFHHDARFASNGDIYALFRQEEIVFHYFFPAPILNDYVVILSANGQIKKKYPLFDLLKGHVRLGHIFNIYRSLLQPGRTWRLLKKIFTDRNAILFSQRSVFDLFHTNSVEFIESSNGLFQKGDLLISCRNISIVAVVNLEKRQILWFTDQFTMQHQPGFLANGNILAFDNGLSSTGSRVAELNPQTKQIVWEYKAQDFYAYNRGGTQRLPNGNTLITESPDGRAFEVTKEGKIVWEFFTPPDRRGRRAVIYRLMRFSSSDGYSCLRNFFPPSNISR